MSLVGDLAFCKKVWVCKYLKYNFLSTDLTTEPILKWIGQLDPLFLTWRVIYFRSNAFQDHQQHCSVLIQMCWALNNKV